MESIPELDLDSIPEKNDDLQDEPAPIAPMVQTEFERLFNDPTAAPMTSPDDVDVYNFCKNVIFRSKMEKECSIICLVYIERLLNLAQIRIDELNWKRLVFITLVIGSKVWDDESYENVHFAKVFTRFTLKDIVDMERMFLALVNFNVGIKSSEYAKYYFILRTYSE
jgi:hypothetical protein